MKDKKLSNLRLIPMEEEYLTQHWLFAKSKGVKVFNIDGINKLQQENKRLKVFVKQIEQLAYDLDHGCSSVVCDDEIAWKLYELIKQIEVG